MRFGPLGLLACHAGILAAASAAPPVSSSSILGRLPLRIETRIPVISRLSNVHVSWAEDEEDAGLAILLDALDGRRVELTYGPCGPHATRQQAHHAIGHWQCRRGEDPARTRLVWVVPEEDGGSEGCISAWAGEELVGRSEPQTLHRRYERRKRDSVNMDNASGIDTSGPWFDGVAQLETASLEPVDVAAAKAKEIAIVGAGMSGLATFLVLHQAGFTKLSLIEAGQRLGGRVHTEYLSGGPFDYSYQEMGPMRFPQTVTLDNVTHNVSDHQIVFQLAAEMNALNGGDRNFSVDFIPWIQSDANAFAYYRGFKLADTGLPPTVSQIAADPSLDHSEPEIPDSARRLDEKYTEEYLGGDAFLAELAQNSHRAHRDFLANGLKGMGGDAWSEWGFMVNYMNASMADADASGAMYDESSWQRLYEDLYFRAASWRTIDGGLNRLPLSFHPLVDNRTTMGRRVERIRRLNDTGRLELQWRDSFRSAEFHGASYDFVVLAVPFTIARKMRLPPLPITITNAINNMPYVSACKVALEFSERFWEHLPNPIHGGCSTVTDIPGLGSLCYPSYNLNGSGPASVLASYISSRGDFGRLWTSVSEEEHVQYVLDAFVEIHGEDVRALYTGNFNRRCWANDPLTAASWAAPDVGMHQLYIPEYFRTYDGLIFVGEHTSYTHAWIASAVESGIRGGVQLMLQLGLVDEAKQTVDKWMARWIDV